PGRHRGIGALALRVRARSGSCWRLRRLFRPRIRGWVRYRRYAVHKQATVIRMTSCARLSLCCFNQPELVVTEPLGGVVSAFCFFAATGIGIHAQFIVIPTLLVPRPILQRPNNRDVALALGLQVGDLTS